MTGCWVELQLENTVLDFPLSDLSTIHSYRGHPLHGTQLQSDPHLDTVKEAEQSGGSASRGKISSTRRVWPGDTRHRHSAPVWTKYFL